MPRSEARAGGTIDGLRRLQYGRTAWPAGKVAPMLKVVRVCFAGAIGSIPAVAQGTKPIDETRCAEQFKAADLDNDGALGRAEIGSFKPNLSASLVNKDRVAHAEFMAVYGKTAS